MKTAVSIPNALFEMADQLARHTKKSRSQLYSDALQDYLARHAPDEITDAMNKVIDDIGETTDEFHHATARRVLRRTEW